jgi:hypothetical protein
VRGVFRERGDIGWSAVTQCRSRRDANTSPSPHVVLLRGFCNPVARRVGFGFRPDLGVEKRSRKTRLGGANRGKGGKYAQKRCGTRGRFPHRFWRSDVRRTHELKNRNVGNSSAKNPRGGGKGYFGGRATRPVRADVRQGSKYDGGPPVDRRATRRDHGGELIPSACLSRKAGPSMARAERPVATGSRSHGWASQQWHAAEDHSGVKSLLACGD